MSAWALLCAHMRLLPVMPLAEQPLRELLGAVRQVITDSLPLQQEQAGDETVAAASGKLLQHLLGLPDSGAGAEPPGERSAGGAPRVWMPADAQREARQLLQDATAAAADAAPVPCAARVVQRPVGVWRPGGAAATPATAPSGTTSRGANSRAVAPNAMRRPPATAPAAGRAAQRPSLLLAESQTEYTAIAPCKRAAPDASLLTDRQLEVCAMVCELRALSAAGSKRGSWLRGKAYRCSCCTGCCIRVFCLP